MWGKARLTCPFWIRKLGVSIYNNKELIYLFQGLHLADVLFMW